MNRFEQGQRVRVALDEELRAPGTVQCEHDGIVDVLTDGGELICAPRCNVSEVENPCGVCGAEFGEGACDDCADKRAADARSAAGWA